MTNVEAGKATAAIGVGEEVWRPAPGATAKDWAADVPSTVFAEGDAAGGGGGGGGGGGMVLVAVKPIAVGDLITLDYATAATATFECSCSASGCRTTIKVDDWKLPALQDRYTTCIPKANFLPHIQPMIATHQCEAAEAAEAAAAGGVVLAPTEVELPSKEEMEKLIAEEKSYIAKWGIEIKHQEKWGRYLEATKPIPKGEVVCKLAPYNICSFYAVRDNPAIGFINALRVAGSSKKDYLFTASADTESYDNFLNHSCSANLHGRVRRYHALEFVATADIPPGTSLSFDYDEFELDLVEQDEHFPCACTGACRGKILGRGYRHDLVGKPLVPTYLP
eukprot:gene4599-16595_t